MDFREFIKPELLGLVAVLYALGTIIKDAKAVKDKYIPCILTGVGILLSCLYVIGTEGINATSIFTSIAQGIMCAAGAVYSNQLIKQTSKDK